MVSDWTRVASALVACTLGCNAIAAAAPVVIDDFATGRGHFSSAVDAVPLTAGLSVANSSITHDPVEGRAAPGALKVVVDDDPDADFRDSPWRLIVPSGGGIPANNPPVPSVGFAGYWLKTTAADLTTSLIVNDGGGTEQGRLKSVIADGQWHLYEWNLGIRSNSSEWLNFSGGTGVIDRPTLTVNSIQLWTRGVPRVIDATVWIDDVSHSTSGSLFPEPASLLPLAAIGMLLKRHRRRVNDH